MEIHIPVFWIVEDQSRSGEEDSGVNYHPNRQPCQTCHCHQSHSMESQEVAERPAQRERKSQL